MTLLNINSNIINLVSLEINNLRFVCIDSKKKKTYNGFIFYDNLYQKSLTFYKHIIS